jgi:hypothetical protein
MAPTESDGPKHWPTGLRELCEQDRRRNSAFATVLIAKTLGSMRVPTRVYRHLIGAMAKPSFLPDSRRSWLPGNPAGPPSERPTTTTEEVLDGRISKVDQGINLSDSPLQDHGDTDGPLKSQRSTYHRPQKKILMAVLLGHSHGSARLLRIIALCALPWLIPRSDAGVDLRWSYRLAPLGPSEPAKAPGALRSPNAPQVSPDSALVLCGSYAPSLSLLRRRPTHGYEHGDPSRVRVVLAVLPLPLAPMRSPACTFDPDVCLENRQTDLLPPQEPGVTP